MANIRNLKKDINYVASELVVECLTYNLIFPEKNHDGLAEIISDSLTMRSVLVKKINSLRKIDAKLVKTEVKSIKNDFMTTTENLIQRLEKFEKE